jgi:hypothetical protein
VNVKKLAIGVAVLLVLAGGGWWAQSWLNAPRTAAREGKPLLAAVDLTQAARIEVVGHAAHATLTASPEGWLVEEQGRFPADQGKLGSLLFKLSEEKLADKVTDNPARLGELGLLTAEENGGKLEENKTAKRFVIRDQAGKTLYELLIGKDRQAGPTTSAAGGQYVRFPGEAAAYLVGTTLLVDPEAKDWIQRALLPPDIQKQFQRIRVTPAGKKPLVFAREKADAPWQLDGASQRGLNVKEIENLAKRIADLEAVQVAQADATPAELGRAKTALVEVSLFDGRGFRIEVGEAQAPDKFRYLSLGETLTPSVKDAALKQEAAAFNARFGKRHVAVQDWEAGRLLKERKEYMQAGG